MVPPDLLLVPGLGNSGPGHWQSLWETRLPGAIRADLGSWDRPTPALWTTRLDAAITSAFAASGAPLLLVAHSLGCLAVAGWAARHQPRYRTPVAGALLVAPPDVEDPATLAQLPALAPFAPAPRRPLPFPSILVASRTDSYARPEAARALARCWGSHFVDAGDAGHINADSNLHEWRAGLALLARLAERRPTPQNHHFPARPAPGTTTARAGSAQPWTTPTSSSTKPMASSPSASIARPS
jgi:predicted alpha/beta hydrolase family esterase